MPRLKNTRQERFVQELVKGNSGREALRRAGFSPSPGHSSRLLRRPDIQQRYEELAGAAMRHTEVTAVRVINEIAAIAFANMIDFITFDADGKPQASLAKLSREQTAALVEFSADTRRVRFKLADKLEALAHLGKMLGLFRERMELSGTGGAPIETREISDFEAARRIAFVLAKAAATERNAAGEK